MCRRENQGLGARYWILATFGPSRLRENGIHGLYKHCIPLSVLTPNETTSGSGGVGGGAWRAAGNLTLLALKTDTCPNCPEFGDHLVLLPFTGIAGFRQLYIPKRSKRNQSISLELKQCCTCSTSYSTAKRCFRSNRSPFLRAGLSRRLCEAGETIGNLKISRFDTESSAWPGFPPQAEAHRLR